MDNRIAVRKIDFPNCRNHHTRLGKYEILGTSEFLCQECYAIYKGDGLLIDKDDEQNTIALRNYGKTSTGETLYKSSSIVYVQTSFASEHWKDFGIEEDEWLNKQERNYNRNELKDIKATKHGQLADLLSIYDEYEHHQMIYNNKDYEYIEIGDIKYFYLNGFPQFSLRKGIPYKVYDFDILRSFSKR